MFELEEMDEECRERVIRILFVVLEWLSAMILLLLLMRGYLGGETSRVDEEQEGEIQKLLFLLKYDFYWFEKSFNKPDIKSK